MIRPSGLQSTTPSSPGSQTTTFSVASGVLYVRKNVFLSSLLLLIMMSSSGVHSADSDRNSEGCLSLISFSLAFRIGFSLIASNHSLRTVEAKFLTRQAGMFL